MCLEWEQRRHAQGGGHVLSLAEKVRRVRLARGLSQDDLAKLANLGRSSITQIEQGLRKELRPDTFKSLVAALKVEPVYFQTDDPREYLRARIANMDSAEAMTVSALRPHQRWEWILADLDLMWGDDWTLSKVGERLGISEGTLRNMLAGEIDMPASVDQALMKATGVPFTFIAGGRSVSTDELLSRYRAAFEVAQRGGISPEQLEMAVRLMVTARG